MQLRSVLSALCLTAMVAVSIHYEILTLPFIDRAPIERAMTMQPDRQAWSPDYPKFLAAVRERTTRGDSITLMVPVRSWEGGYAYAYYRASYLLAGRVVLPIMAPGDKRLPQNFNGTKYVAVWPASSLRRIPPADSSPEGAVFSAFGGVLLRR